MLLRLAIKEIVNHRRFFLLLVINAAMGLLGLTAVESFRASVQTALLARAKTLLGADLEISGRNRPDPKRLRAVEGKFPVFEAADSLGLYSMLRNGESSRLVHIKVLPPNYPFYGEIELAEGGSEIRHSEHGIWIYEELTAQMGLKPGDMVELGDAVFSIEGVVIDEPQQGMAGAMLAPRVFLSMEGIEKAGLITAGSLVIYSRHYRFEEPFRLSESDAANISSTLDDPAIRVSTPEDASERLGARLNFISDFLGLVSLVALFLASIGIFYLYRNYLYRRSRDMAIYRTLGITGREVTALYLYQLLILGTAATILGGALGYTLMTLVSNTIISDLLFPLEIGFSLRLALLLPVTGIVGTLLLALPLLSNISRIKPLTLIQGSGEEAHAFSGRRKLAGLITWLPWILFFGLLSVVVSHSFVIGGIFFAVFLGLPLVLFPICLLALRFAIKVSDSLPFSLRMAVLYAGRFRFATTATFIAIFFSALLLTLVPLIQKGLLAELSSPRDGWRPSFFLFDIQEDQKEELERFLEQEGVELADMSAMIRGRLKAVNGVQFGQMQRSDVLTREDESELRFRNRGLNLTYRNELSESESVIQGRYFERSFDPLHDTIGEVSVEHRYAARLGLKMGDILEIEVFDMPVEVKITSLRRVRWTSFSPNFFLILQPGIIDEAPAVYLAATGHIPEENRATFQSRMLDSFPSISIIDLNRLVERLIILSRQIAGALHALTALAFLVGALVLFSISSHQMEMKKRDVVLLKTLGLNFSELAGIFRIECVAISLSAALLGTLLGTALSKIAGMLFFDSIWAFDVLVPIGVTAGIVAIALVVYEFSIRKVLRVPTRSILDETPAGSYGA